MKLKEMKKPNIIYCNVIREDKESDRVAIKSKHIYEMIDALIGARKLIKTIEKKDHEEIVSGYFLFEVLRDIDSSLKGVGAK